MYHFNAYRSRRVRMLAGRRRNMYRASLRKRVARRMAANLIAKWWRYCNYNRDKRRRY